MIATVFTGAYRYLSMMTVATNLVQPGLRELRNIQTEAEVTDFEKV